MVKEKESQITQIINELRGTSGYKIILKGRKLIQKDSQGNDLKETIRYIYGCGKTKQEIIEEEGEKRRKLIYTFIEFYGREEMEKIGVLF